MVGRPAEVDEFDIKVVLGEDAPLFRDRCSDGTGRICIPGEIDFARRALQRFPARGSAANRRVAGKIGGVVSARAAPNTPNGAAAPKAPARPRTERRDNPRRFASGRPFDELLPISRVSMAHPKTALRIEKPVGIAQLRATPKVLPCWDHPSLLAPQV